MDWEWPARRDAARVVIDYKDSGGAHSERQITPIKFIGTLINRRTGESAASVSKIEAYCHLRKAPRSFLIGSISAIADSQTGEIIDLRSWIEQSVVRPGQRLQHDNQDGSLAFDAGVQYSRPTNTPPKKGVISRIGCGCLKVLLFLAAVVAAAIAIVIFVGSRL